jgi:cystathionine beta-synthase
MLRRAEEAGLKPGGTDRRGHERQHGRVARAARRGARLQVHLRHARQDEPGEDQPPARVRRQGRRLPDGRRARGPAQLLQGVAPHRRRDAELASTRTSTTTPPTPRRTTSRARPRSGKQTGGDFDVFVAGMGTGGTISGCRQVLQGEEARDQIVGVDPGGLALLRLRQDRPHHQAVLVQGRGHRGGLLPDDDEPQDLDDIVRVDDKECFLMTRDLTRLEGALRRRLGRRCGGGRAQVRARLGRGGHRSRRGSPRPNPRISLRTPDTSTSRRSSTTTGCARTVSSRTRRVSAP